MYKLRHMKQKKSWNKGRVVGTKPPLSPDQVSLLKMRLNEAGVLRDLVLFSVAVDTSFRGCDLVSLRVSDIMSNGEVHDLVTIQQQKTGGRVTVHIIPHTQALLKEYIEEAGKGWNDWLFTPLKGKSLDKALSVNQYRALVKKWLSMAGLNPMKYGTHSLRRTKVSLIYRKTGNLRACQKLLGHSSIQHTANYLGIEEAEALEIARSICF